MHNKLSVDKIKGILERNPGTDFLGKCEIALDPDLSVFHMDLQLFLE